MYSHLVVISCGIELAVNNYELIYKLQNYTQHKLNILKYMPNNSVILINFNSYTVTICK